MLHHVELYVSDLKKSEEFWGWLLKELDYKVYQKWEYGVSYKYDHIYIVFVQAEHKYMDIPYHRSRVGLNHLAFYAKSKEQIDKITLELKRMAINILYLDKHPHAGGKDHYAVYFEDPDRIKVELVAPLKL